MTTKHDSFDRSSAADAFVHSSIDERNRYEPPWTPNVLAVIWWGTSCLSNIEITWNNLDQRWPSMGYITGATLNDPPWQLENEVGVAAYDYDKAKWGAMKNAWQMLAGQSSFRLGLLHARVRIASHNAEFALPWYPTSREPPPHEVYMQKAWSEPALDRLKALTLAVLDPTERFTRLLLSRTSTNDYPISHQEEEDEWLAWAQATYRNFDDTFDFPHVVARHPFEQHKRWLWEVGQNVMRGWDDRIPWPAWPSDGFVP